jgi:hypothetical protein
MTLKKNIIFVILHKSIEKITTEEERHFPETRTTTAKDI